MAHAIVRAASPLLATPSANSPAPQEGPEVFHEQHETHFVNWRRTEAEAKIEGARSGVNCLHQDSTDSNRFGSLLGTQQSILQQGHAKAFALLGPIDCEAS